MPDVSDEENTEFTEEQTKDINEDGEENDEEAAEDNSEDGEENEDDNEEPEDQEENDEDKSEGGEENEEATTEGAEDDGEAAAADDIEIDVENDSTHEVVKKLTMKEKFNDMERKKILIASLIFSLVISLPSGLGIGLGTAPIPDYCAYPKFKPCRDHGSCTMIDKMAHCECGDGWDGELCQLKTCDHPDSCVQDNIDKCTYSKELGPTCHCKDGFTGRHCEDVIEVPDLCSKAEYNDCNNHGSCSIVDDLPTCACEEGWTGKTCQYMNCDNPEACVDGHYSSCQDNQSRGAVCMCHDIYTGHNCGEEIDQPDWGK